MPANMLFAVMPEHERGRIAPYCESVSLHVHDRLCYPDEPLRYAYFPESGACSALVHGQNGEAVEVGLIGREGMVGLPLALGEATNPFEVMVQIPGVAVRISRDAFLNHVLAPGHGFCNAVLKYANLYMATVAQTAVCNRAHQIDQRLARWLLEMRERAGTDVLPMTHEVLGMMLGAYRPSITNALKTLSERGLVQIGRARLTITDANGLAREACECHQTIRRRTAETLQEIRQLAA